jgi:hypothetical protein
MGADALEEGAKAMLTHLCGINSKLVARKLDHTDRNTM